MKHVYTVRFNVPLGGKVIEDIQFSNVNELTAQIRGASHADREMEQELEWSMSDHDGPWELVGASRRATRCTLRGADPGTNKVMVFVEITKQPRTRSTDEWLRREVERG